MIIIPETHRVQ